MTKSNKDSLNKIKSEVASCTKCELHKTRLNTVFGEKDYNAQIIIIGEGPGANEDKTGRPFVGRAGKLLDEVLFKYGLSREKGVFITNIVKCRPPENRKPKKKEIECCLPYLKEQIRLINPRLIILLGLTAAKSYLGIDEQMKNIRGEIITVDGRNIMVTYHPAAILRNPNLRNFLEQDIHKASEL
ncbi:MAG: uracil-DNA glycosylase family protein [Bacteroidales bacterium]